MEVFTCFFSPEPHPRRLDLFCCCDSQCIQLSPAPCCSPSNPHVPAGSWSTCCRPAPPADALVPLKHVRGAGGPDLRGVSTSGEVSCLPRECIVSLYFLVQAGGWCLRASYPKHAHLCLYSLLLQVRCLLRVSLSPWIPDRWMEPTGLCLTESWRSLSVKTFSGWRRWGLDVVGAAICVLPSSAGKIIMLLWGEKVT